MSAALPSSLHFQPPKFQVDYDLGPSPKRLSPGDDLTFLFCDSAELLDAHTVFNVNANTSIYRRYEAMSPKNGKKVVLFGTTPLELQIIDHYKELSGKRPKLDSWARCIDGRGMVKQFGDMRTSAYLYQTFLMSIRSVMGISVRSHLSDINPTAMVYARDEPTSCPAADRERNDLRIDAFRACAELIRAKYPTAKIIFYFRCDRLVGRMKELASIDPNGATLLSSLGEVRMGTRAKKIKTDLDGILDTAMITTKPTQPKPHPSAVPSHVEWADLGQDTINWIVTPRCLPLVNLPSTITPLQGIVVRWIPDSCFFSHRHKDLQELVNLFSGDIKLSALDRIVIELGLGFNGGTRLQRLRKVLASKPSETWPSFGNIPNSLIFEADKPPYIDPNPATGDMRIRSELAMVIKTLEKVYVGRRLVVVFLTVDYGCELLLHSIPTDFAIFLCIRVGDLEKGEECKKLVYSILKAFLQ